jgi:hypothetical protein
MVSNQNNKRQELTIQDYKKILTFYKIPIPVSSQKIQKEAEDILSYKLCRCIKKVGSLEKGKANAKVNESRAIGICSKTILGRKGLTRGKFNCRGKRNITLKKRA